MELSETYDTRVEVRKYHYHNIHHIDTQQNFRNMSPRAEKDQLIRKIEALASKNSVLLEKQDSLQNTVYVLLFRSMTYGNYWSL